MRVPLFSLLFIGCAAAFNGGLPEPVDYPADVALSTNYAGFHSLRFTNAHYIVSFDNNGDSIPDAWWLWTVTPGANYSSPHREMVDRDYDGIIDTWTYAAATNRAYMERDTNGDGKVDTWIFRKGFIEKDTNYDGLVDSTNRLGSSRIGEGPRLNIQHSDWSSCGDLFF